MTAHQDVAGLVARLRFDADRCDIQFSKGVATNITEAADRIESLSQALREAEAEKESWKQQYWVAVRKHVECCGPANARAEAAESRLAEAMKVIDGLLKSACAAAQVMSDGIYRIDATEEEWLSHIAACQTARAFIAGNNPGASNADQ